MYQRQPVPAIQVRYLYAVNYYWIVSIGDAQPVAVSNTPGKHSIARKYDSVPGGYTREMVTSIAGYKMFC